MKEGKDRVGTDRRGFLKLASLGTIVGGAALALGRKPAEASVKPASPHGEGYRESDHVKTYYKSARF